MENIIDMYKNALSLYDKKKLNDKNNFKNLTNVKMELSYNDIKLNKITLKSNKTIIYKGEFEIISVVNLNIWSWVWSIPIFDNSISLKTKKILDFGLNIKGDINNDIIEQLHGYLINTNVVLDNKIKKELLLAIVMYLTKATSIIKLKLTPDAYDQMRANLFLKKKKINLDLLNHKINNKNALYYTIYIYI